MQETGIWLHESGVLGATPDALVERNHISEIKSPYTAGDKTVSQALEEVKNFFFKKNDYWHQVQGQMSTKRAFCYFVVWKTKEVVVPTIQRDMGTKH